MKYLQNPKDRVGAIEVLGHFGVDAKSAESALVDLLKGGDYLETKSILMALTEISADPFSLIKGYTTVDKTRSQQESAILALGKLGKKDPRAVATLIDLLKGHLKPFATMALKSSGDNAVSAVPALTENFKEYSSTLFEDTLDLFYILGPKASSAADNVIEILSEKNHIQLRNNAKQTLEKFGEKIIPNLIKALEADKNKKDETLKGSVCQLLANHREKSLKAAPVLLKTALNSYRESTKEEAIDALVKIGEKAVPTLIEGVKSKDPYVVILCIDSLKKLGPKAKSAIPELKKIVGPDLMKSILKSIDPQETGKN
jgi:HEAT repeat protein